jgi:membrane protease YdiL (CAAX protease family)
MPLIPSVVDILWRGDAAFVLTGYLVHLPIHLLACWSYQKTDNVWTPLITLAVTNLLTSIILPLLLLR